MRSCWSWRLGPALLAILAAVQPGGRDRDRLRAAGRHGGPPCRFRVPAVRRVYDAIVYRAQPLPETGHAARVSVVTPIRAFHGQPWCSCGRKINQGESAVREVPAPALGRVVKLVSRRPPDQASIHETLASFTLQRDYGIGPGTAIRLPMAAASSGGRCARPWLAARSPSPPGPHRAADSGYRGGAARGSGRYRPARRARTRSGDLPDHADLRGRHHRQPRRRAGTRRRGAQGPLLLSAADGRLPGGRDLLARRCTQRRFPGGGLV